MPPTPRPSDWQGGSEDFGFLRTFDGHLGANVNEVPADRTNVRQGFAAADIGGQYDADNDISATGSDSDAYDNMGG